MEKGGKATGATEMVLDLAVIKALVEYLALSQLPMRKLGEIFGFLFQLLLM